MQIHHQQDMKLRNDVFYIAALQLKYNTTYEKLFNQCNINVKSMCFLMSFLMSFFIIALNHLEENWKIVKNILSVC